MPYRKYKPKKGKYGPIYHIATGIVVFRNEQAKWLIRMNKGGKRKNKTIGTGRNSLVKAIKSAEELSEKLASTKISASTIQTNSESVMPTFLEYSKSWLENDMRWRNTTVEKYEGILRLHIWSQKRFSSKFLDEIKRKDIKRLLFDLAKRVSISTVETTQVVIHSVFESAIDDEIISQNPAKRILKKILPSKNRRKRSKKKPLTKQEGKLFLECVNLACSKPIALIIKIMLYSGVRLGEALAMKVENLDLENKRYLVAESFRRGEFQRPKSGKSRLVDLPNFLVDELAQYVNWRAKRNLLHGADNNSGLLFSDPENADQPFSQRKIQIAMRKVCIKAKIDIRTPHDLRHTYASWLLMAHQSPMYVKEQLGHSSIDITVDIYGHWFSGQGRNGLEEALQFEQNPTENCISSAYQ